MKACKCNFPIQQAHLIQLWLKETVHHMEFPMKIALPGFRIKLYGTLSYSQSRQNQVHSRRFLNKCDIVEETYSSSEHGVRVKVFSQIKRNFLVTREKKFILTQCLLE